MSRREPAARARKKTYGSETLRPLPTIDITRKEAIAAAELEYIPAEATMGALEYISG